MRPWAIWIRMLFPVLPTRNIRVNACGSKSIFRSVPMAYGMRITKAEKYAVSLLLAVLVCSAAKPDQWNGLVLDSATPDQATQVLGPPAKSDTGQLARLMRKHLVNRSPALMTVKNETVTVMKWE